MSTVATAPPARHGKCCLWLTINHCRYKLMPERVAGKGSKGWHLIKLDDPRALAHYLVLRIAGVTTCTCADHRIVMAECKHMRALAAAGLIAKGGRKGVARG